jgi:hypothetical protein
MSELSIIAIIAAFAVILSLKACADGRADEAAARAGLVQQRDPSGTILWVKPEPEKTK